MGITFGGSIWIARGYYFDRLCCFRVFWCSRPAQILLLYGGNIPFLVSLCFASQRIPTVCPHCAGSISTIGLRSFLLKVSGVSSHLSFCCTCLVSGFIISEKRPLVHSQSAQKIRQSFSISACKTVNIDIFSSILCLSASFLPSSWPPSWSMAWSSASCAQGRECGPRLIYKFYISDIPVLYTIWNFIQICPFGLASNRAFG